MNAAAKTRTRTRNRTRTRTFPTAPFGTLNQIVTSKQFWRMNVLIIAVLTSAIAVVYVQARNRLLFSQLQTLQRQRDAMYVRWGQLLLEQSAFVTQARVQHIAEQRFNMVIPEQSKIVMVTE